MCHVFRIVLLTFLALPAFSKEVDRLSVLDAGADRTGETDASLAIQITIERAAFEKKAVYLPSGKYLITHGFLLPDETILFGDGIGRTVLLLQKNLPARSIEATQTAVFTGVKSFSLLSTFPTKNISIRELSIELDKKADDFKYENFSMLGGVRLINPVGCVLKKIEIINPPKFGINLSATEKGNICNNNIVDSCIVRMQEGWYLQTTPILIPRSNETCIGIQCSSFEGNFINGTSKFLSRNNPNYYTSKMIENRVTHNIVVGGSHGVSITNASRNIISHNIISSCSHRGIIMIGASDSNLIANNKLLEIGSTGIHLAFDCNNNLIQNNIVDGVLGVQGDGIKTYINCNHNTISNNSITNFAVTGIRIAHGANYNIVKDNIITCTKPGLIGIKIIGNTKEEYDDGYRFVSTLTAANNICSGNRIYNALIGIFVADEVSKENTTRDNTVTGNYFENVRTGIEYSAATKRQKVMMVRLNTFKKTN